MFGDIDSGTQAAFVLSGKNPSHKLFSKNFDFSKYQIRYLFSGRAILIKVSFEISTAIIKTNKFKYMYIFQVQIKNCLKT